MKLLEATGRPIGKAAFVFCLIAASVILIILQVRWMKSQESRFLDTPIIQFSRIIDQQTLRIMCDACEGAGLLRRGDDPEKLEVCSLCFGLGVHRVRQVHQNDVLCPGCRGLARVPLEAFNESKPCERCRGRGLVALRAERFPIHANSVPCNFCDGRGVVRDPENEKQLLTCPICYGLGGNLIRKLDATSAYCAGCDGMGRLIDPGTGEARYCTRCDGRGLAVNEAPVAATVPEEESSYQ